MEMHDKESKRQQLYRLLQVELEKINQNNKVDINQNNKVDINESILTPLQEVQNRLRILEYKLNKTDNSQELIVECKGFNKKDWSKYYYAYPYYFQQGQMDKYGQQNTNEYDGLDRKHSNKQSQIIFQDEQNTNQTYSNQTDNKNNNQSDNSQYNKQNVNHLIQSNNNNIYNQQHKQSLYQQNNSNTNNHKHPNQSQKHQNKSINTNINYNNYNHIKQNIKDNNKNNTLSTTTKRKSKSSSNINNSTKITPQNTQLNTPHKNNQLIHSYSNTLKIQQNTNYTNKTNHTKILTPKQITNHKQITSYKLNSHQKHNHNQSQNRMSYSNKKSRSLTSQIQDKFNTDNKLTPKYLSNIKMKKINSQTKSKTKTKTKSKSKSTHKSIKKYQKYQNNKYPFLLTEEQDNPKKVLLKLSTNLRLSNKKNNTIYNVLDHHILRYSRQPLIPLKEKIHLQRQLKQYEKQNKKLKKQIGHLKKYQQEYSKIKQVFQNSHQNQIKINKSQIYNK